MFYIRDEKRLVKPSQKFNFNFKNGFFIFQLTDKNFLVNAVEYKKEINGIPQIKVFQEVLKNYDKKNEIIIEYFQINDTDEESIDIDKLSEEVVEQLKQIKTCNIIKPTDNEVVDLNEFMK